MLNDLKGVIDPILAEANVTAERFKVIAVQLMSAGCIMREENVSEKAMYDEAVRIDSLLHDYFAVVGLTLHHDSVNYEFRLYPPGAVAPGVNMVDESPEGTASIRQRLPIDVVAATLALRCLYEERMQRGLIETSGEALVTLEDLSATLSTQLRRPLPVNQTDKMSLLNELKKLRVIRLTPNFTVQDPDGFIAIRGGILTLVSNDALNNALEAMASADSQDNAAAVAEASTEAAATAPEALQEEPPAA